MSKYIELCKKLKALAEKGVGGEKANAKKMLSTLMEIHNITIDKIEEEEIKSYYFTITKSNFPLWHQIVKCVNYKIKVYGSFPQKVIKFHKLPGNYMIESTTYEYVEIKTKYDFYQQLLKDEYDLFFSAFLHVNNLLVDYKDKREIKLTDDDIKKELRIRELAKGIKKGEFKKYLK